jgi:hypothetical protein
VVPEAQIKSNVEVAEETHNGIIQGIFMNLIESSEGILEYALNGKTTEAYI